MSERWIVIPNWDGSTGFQHYKDRTPRWIKNYTELMSDDAYLGLTLHQRGVLHGLWLEYAAARRQIPDSTLAITRRLGDRVTRATLDALNHAGFITYSASKPLAQPEQPASPEKSREEKNPPTPRTAGGTNSRANGTNPRANPPVFPCPDCRYQAPTAGDLAAHRELVHTLELPVATIDPDDIPF